MRFLPIRVCDVNLDQRLNLDLFIIYYYKWLISEK